MCVCERVWVCVCTCVHNDPLGSNFTTDEGPWKGAESLGLTPVCIPGAFMWMGGLGEALDMLQGAPPPRLHPLKKSPSCRDKLRRPAAAGLEVGVRWGPACGRSPPACGRSSLAQLCRSPSSLWKPPGPQDLEAGVCDAPRKHRAPECPHSENSAAARGQWLPRWTAHPCPRKLPCPFCPKPF